MRSGTRGNNLFHALYQSAQDHAQDHAQARYGLAMDPKNRSIEFISDDRG